MCGKVTASLPGTSCSTAASTASPANSHPREQQQSWGHPSRSHAIGSLKSQAYLPIDLLSSVKLRKMQDKHKQTSPSRLRGNRMGLIPPSGAGEAGRKEIKHNSDRMPILDETSPSDPHVGGPAAPGIVGIHHHPQLLRWRLQQRRWGSQRPTPFLHGVDLISKVVRNNTEGLKGLLPPQKITSQSKRAL